MIRLTKTTPARARRSGTVPARMRGGFTLVELLVVIVVLAILAALLLPAINSAIRTSKNAAVSAEINQLAQALESFKSKYGDYPPSRFLAVENGNYSALLGSTIPLNTTGYDPTSPGTGDITVGQLAQRSVSALRKFWPRVSTTGLGTGIWYDFNGDGINQSLNNTVYILHGHECLVFFLGGVPLLDHSTGGYGMTGFGKDPTNPFTNSIASDSNYHNNPNPMYNANRQPPLFEFNAGRLFLDPNSRSGIPGYLDSLGNTPPTAAGSAPVNFFSYFSAYGSGHYDPNDVNFPELDHDNSGPDGPIGLQYQASFPVYMSTYCTSLSPNPYTGTLTANNPVGALSTGTVTYQKPQTYQIIASGVDGLYGVGGQYVTNTTTSATVPLPFDANNAFGVGAAPNLDANVRNRERDNLTNFKTGTIQ
jgi:prepilin-type N-terminal cleavage/methylation domain-containing protein